MKIQAVEGRRTFNKEELLADNPFSEPLIANGVRCHGGFDADGNYGSPRTLHRNPAVSAWQHQLISDGHEILGIPENIIPPHYPGIEQAKLLLRNNVVDPMVRSLTIISIVEGFGATIRDVEVPDLESVLVEPTEGTALAHLGKGLYEAHARDEAGWGDQGGHKQMWEAARDLGLNNPTIPPDVFMRVMGGGGSRNKVREQQFPELDPKLHRMIQMMAQVLVIEEFAQESFSWGKAVLSDPEVSADPKGAGDMVDYIRGDESPHVQYLMTALSEIRARTLKTVDGKTIAGKVVVDGMLHKMLQGLTKNRPQQQREDIRESVLDALKKDGANDSLLEEYDSLQPKWDAPELTGFEAV